MWFTIAFFIYPIALYLIYSASVKKTKNRALNIILSIIIIIIPIGLMLIEKGNIEDTEKELIGVYSSEKDTLTLNQGFYSIKESEIIKRGSWELIIDGKLTVLLEGTNSSKNELQISFENGMTKLTAAEKTYRKIEKP